MGCIGDYYSRSSTVAPIQANTQGAVGTQLNVGIDVGRGVMVGAINGIVSVMFYGEQFGDPDMLGDIAISAVSEMFSDIVAGFLPAPTTQGGQLVGRFLPVIASTGIYTFASQMVGTAPRKSTMELAATQFMASGLANFTIKANGFSF